MPKRIRTAITHLPKISYLTNLIKAVSGVTAIGLLATQAQGAGLEYSRQSIAPLLESGNYIELSYAYVDADIEGQDSLGNDIDDMMDSIDLPSAAIKVMPTPNTALAVVYEKPFGVDTIYQAGSVFANDTGTTEARVNTDGITFLGGGNISNDVNNQIWIFGGIEYQTIDGDITGADKLGIENVIQSNIISRADYNALVAGENAGVLTPTQQAQLAGIRDVANSDTYYELEFEKDSDLVPVLGIGYERPDIALKASLTYRAATDYKLKSKERITTIAGTDPDQLGQVEVELPQSVNLDFQTGLSEKYQLLGMLNARWVNWSDFVVNPPLSAVLTQEPLATYGEDAYSVEVALGKQFTPKFAGEIRIGYDSGTGEPISLLGPYDAFKTLGLSGEYQLTDNLDIAIGGQYIWFDGGDIITKLNGNVAKIDDGTGYALGVKLGYHF